MPVQGFKTITVSEEIYQRYAAWWEKNQESYKVTGITSFSGFMPHQLSEAHKQIGLKIRFLQIHSPVLPESIILLNDQWENKIIELERTDDTIFCKSCNKNSCMHVGFCYSLQQKHNPVVSVT